MLHTFQVTELTRDKMKLKLDDKVLLDIDDIIKGVICNDILSEEYDADIERRLQWVIMHKFDQCFQRLKAEWDKKLADRGIEMIPTNKRKYAELVFSQPDYKNRSQREKDGN